MTDITLFQQQKPDIYLRSQIYDSVNNPTGDVIPKVGDLVQDIQNNQGVLYYVQTVDPVTHNSTLAQETIIAVEDGSDDSLASVVSYKNDIYTLYFDNRTKPWTIQPDSHTIVRGISNANYEVLRYPGTPNEVSIALVYDASGTFMGDRPALMPLSSDNPGFGSYFQQCNTTADLVDGEELELVIYNSYGAERARITCTAKQSTIQNENAGRVPVIVGLTIGSAQLRSNNEIYIYERQDPGSLALTVTVNYDDGTAIDVPIDNQRCFEYGLSGFVASYPGLQQTILIKYMISNDQNVSQALLAQNDRYITAEISLVVIPNELTSPVKLAVIPRWNPNLNLYTLFYYLYKVDGTGVTNVTQWVTVSEGSFNGGLFGTAQDFTVLVDLQQVDPVTYLAPTPYQQEVIITLQPATIYQRYTLRDAINSLYVYGVDAPNNRRPVLHYDVNRQQYFVPTSLFPSSDSFLQSFYTESSPPYDTSTSTLPPTPTHFLLRDPATGLALVATPLPINAYEVAFSITGSGDPSRYVSSNVIVEFIVELDNNTSQIIFGASADCYQSPTGYVGP